MANDVRKTAQNKKKTPQSRATTDLLVGDSLQLHKVPALHLPEDESVCLVEYLQHYRALEMVMLLNLQHHHQ
jgi:hypothetical protein